jgi:hypothetical protein
VKALKVYRVMTKQILVLNQYLKTLVLFLLLLLNFTEHIIKNGCRWIDNIKMDLLEIGVNVVDWIGLTQDRYRWRALVNSVMNFLVP